MSRDNERAAEMTRSGDQFACTRCSGPTSPHEETIIMLGHPDRARYLYRCVDPECGGTSILDAGSRGKPGGTE